VVRIERGGEEGVGAISGVGLAARYGSSGGARDGGTLKRQWPCRWLHFLKV
jgi:hypothetical protein